LKEATGTENLLDLVTSSFPPTVLVHGTDDSVAPISDSRVLTTKLRGVDVKVRLIEVAGADHGIHPQEKYQTDLMGSVGALGSFMTL